MKFALAQWQKAQTLIPALSSWNDAVQAQPEAHFPRRHGRFDQWLETLAAMAAAMPEGVARDFTQDWVSAKAELTLDQHDALKHALRTMMPWRKGPFVLGDVAIDSEWRCYLKYQRLIDSGLEIRGKRVLDVGSGNGYYLYRLLGSGAQCAIGMDPSWHSFAQFLLLQHWLGSEHCAYLPSALDHLPLTGAGFDLTMSMGVFYHRRDPLAFLEQLRATLAPGGRLLLETLVIEGGKTCVYLPEDRYAGMRNVWFLPSVAALVHWLKRLKWQVEWVGEPVMTTAQEQRRTDWMQSHSLVELLAESPADEPPPQRVMLIARAP